MLVLALVLALLSGRSPCGERGLKLRTCYLRPPLQQSLPVRGAWIEICACACSGTIASVAPRAGSVD